MKIKFTEDYQTSFDGINLVFFKKGETLEHAKAPKYIELGVAVAVGVELEETKVIAPTENKIKKAKK